MEKPCMTPKTVNAFGCCYSRNFFNFQMTIEDVPQDIVFDGLDRFCEWLFGIYKPVDIISVGTNCMTDGSSVIASVKMDGVEHCFNSRGCNVVVYQKSTAEVVDSFVCDLNRDPLPQIRSKFSQNYIQKLLTEM